MKLATQPPKRIVAETRLPDPLVLTFVVGSTDKPMPGLSSVSDITEASIFLSLMSEDGKELRSSLRGNYVDSVHRIEQPQGEDAKVIAYATFSELAITQPGTYCFGINIIDTGGYVYQDLM